MNDIVMTFNQNNLTSRARFIGCNTKQETVDCGKPFVNAEPLIAFGEPEKYGDLPWNVAIYNDKKVLICGGSIISPHLILSAAHCFTDGKKSLNPKNYEVIIKEIRLPKKGFSGLTTSYQNDMALLVLDEEITMGATVMPVCIDWSGTRKIPPTEATLGKIVGWGMTEHGNYSETLQIAKLPFISHDQCLKSSIPQDFKRFLTYDKFCAGSEKSTAVSIGDTGAGLMFLEKDHYFIRGVLSLKSPANSLIAMYTDLHEHVDRMLSVRNEVEKQIIEKQTKIDFNNNT